MKVERRPVRNVASGDPSLATEVENFAHAAAKVSASILFPSGSRTKAA